MTPDPTVGSGARWKARDHFEAGWTHLDERQRKQYSEGDRLEYGPYVVYQCNQLLARHLPVEPGALWLEVGCGRADTSLYFAKRRVRVCLVDPGPAAIRLAKQNYLEEGCKPLPLQGDGYALSFGEGTFDIVGCSGVLEHLPDCEAVVREMARVVKPGGMCFAIIQVFTRATVQSLLTWMVRIPLAYVKGLMTGGPAKGRTKVRSYLERSYPVNPAVLEDYTAMFGDAGLVDLKVWNINLFPALRLRGWGERAYVRGIQAFLKLRAALGVREPLATSLGVGKGWVIIGMKRRESA